MTSILVATTDQPSDSQSLQDFTLCHTVACISSPYLRKFLQFAAQAAGDEAGACLLTMTPKFAMSLHHGK